MLSPSRADVFVGRRGRSARCMFWLSERGRLMALAMALATAVREREEEEEERGNRRTEGRMSVRAQWHPWSTFTSQGRADELRKVKCVNGKSVDTLVYNSKIFVDVNTLWMPHRDIMQHF